MGTEHWPPSRPCAWAIAIFAAIAATSASAKECSPQPPSTAPTLPPASSVDVDVRVDPRIELLLIVQHLTGDYEKRTNLITDFDFGYKREIEEHFRPFAVHTVVMTYRKMFQRGFSFDAGPHAMLRLTEDDNLAIRAAFPEDILERIGGAKRFEEFRSQLADFAKASGFWKFYEDHKPLYAELCQSVRESAKPGELVAALNDYAGLPVDNAHLVLFPMGHSGGFAAQIERAPGPPSHPDGVTEVFAVVGPGGAVDDKPVFGGDGAPWFESLIIHEFAHTIVNPLADANEERVAKSDGLLKPIREQMAKQAYKSWKTVVNEHIVRALEARIALKRHGVEAGTKKVADDFKRGFVHLPELSKALGRFEADRKQWPTLADFYPELLAVFEAAEKQAK